MANKVLIVDDDKTLCDMYTERLKAEGFEVAVAYNGEEGTAKAIEFLPDVILLDIMMPKVNGFNTLEILKSTEQTKNIPVFLLTALIQEENKRRGIQSGAEDYIIKSETMPGAIIEKIKAAIAKKANPAAGQPVGGSGSVSASAASVTAPPQPDSAVSPSTSGVSATPPSSPPPPATPPPPANPPVTAPESPSTPPEQNVSTPNTPNV